MNRRATLILSIVLTGLVANGARASAALPAILDIDGDGRADMLVAAPGETLPGATAAGSVSILYGSQQGLGKVRTQVLHQGTALVGDTPEAFDDFGGAIAVGNLNGDAFSDVIIGAPGERVNGASFAGQIHVSYGQAGGLGQAQLWNQDSPGVPDSAEVADAFGSALTVGDFNSDGIDDLAVGVNGESLSSPTGSVLAAAGGVQVFHGAPTGIVPSSFLTQPPLPVANNYWGRELTAVLRGDRSAAWLAVGAPNGSVNGLARAGFLTLLPALPGVGLTVNGAQTIHQNTPGVLDQAEANDFFSLSMFSPGSACGTGGARLFVGAPNEGFSNLLQAGQVHALCLRPTGTIHGDVLVRQNPAPQDAAQFGHCLTGVGGFEAGVVIAGAPFANARNRFSGGVFAFRFHPQTGPLQFRGSLFPPAPGTPGAAADGDLFGFACSTYVYDPIEELVHLIVGAPGKTVNARQRAGRVFDYQLVGIEPPTGPFFGAGSSIQQKGDGGPEVGDAYGRRFLRPGVVLRY